MLYRELFEHPIEGRRHAPVDRSMERMHGTGVLAALSSLWAGVGHLAF